MKSLITTLVFSFLTILVSAQIQNPVKWSATSKKIDAKTYEIRLTATIGTGWHIYSQSTPDGGPIPTQITFTKNPLVTIEGPVKEIGKMEKHIEPLFGNIEVRQFSNKVDFVQKIVLKSPVKTSVNMEVEFMVCNDKECLPPRKEKLVVAL